MFSLSRLISVSRNFFSGCIIEWK